MRAIVSTVLFGVFSIDWQPENLGALFQPYRQKSWLKKPTVIIIDFDSQLNATSPFAKFRYELHISNQSDNFLDKKVSYESFPMRQKENFVNYLRGTINHLILEMILRFQIMIRVKKALDQMQAQSVLLQN